MVIEKYTPTEPSGRAYEAISRMLCGLDVGKSYADMMRYRVSGFAANECEDTYYLAIEDETALARLWMGWGKHPDAIGNWGNFFTDEAYRGKGIGKQLIDIWSEDLKSRECAPLCLLCSAGTLALANTYAKLGFVPAIRGRDFGPLYLPIGDSPSDFESFYLNYYKPSHKLYMRKASIGYRHEIDCLLRFVYIDMGLEFGIGEMPSVEAALLYAPLRAVMLFSEDGHAVGWGFDDKLQLHPLYKDLPVIREC